jgi:hypothetical protein
MDTFSRFFLRRRIVNVQPADPVEPPEQLSWVGQTYRDTSGVFEIPENVGSSSARPSTPISAPIMPRQSFSLSTSQSNLFVNAMIKFVNPQIQKTYDGDTWLNRYKNKLLSFYMSSEDEFRRKCVIAFKIYNKSPLISEGIEVSIPVQFLDEYNPPTIDECMLVFFTISFFAGYSNVVNSDAVTYFINYLEQAMDKEVKKKAKIKIRRGLPAPYA